VSQPPNQPPADQPPADKPKTVRRGQVVSFTHPDPVTGRTLEGVGVVLAVEDGGNVTVRPLSTVDLFVDPANVAPVSAGDVS
jgi:hypothetical protein